MDYDNLKDKFLSDVRMLFGKAYWVQFLLNNMILEFSGGLQAEPNLLGLNLWTMHTERNGRGALQRWWGCINMSSHFLARGKRVSCGRNLNKKVKSFLCFLHLRSSLESEVSAAQGSGERGLPTGRPHLGAKHSSPGVSQGKDWVWTSWESGQPSGSMLCL